MALLELHHLEDSKKRLEGLYNAETGPFDRVEEAGVFLFTN